MQCKQIRNIITITNCKNLKSKLAVFDGSKGKINRQRHKHKILMKNRKRKFVIANFYSAKFMLNNKNSKGFEKLIKPINFNDAE